MSITTSFPQTGGKAQIETAERTRIHFIGIAEILVVRAPEQIRTVLGSCVGVALCDQFAGIGGLSHVILPASNEGSGDPGKFADTAVDLLVNRLLVEGASAKHIVAKIAGGANMFSAQKTGGLGQRNADAVQARLAHHSISLMASALGGSKGRKMRLEPATGHVYVEIIGQAPEII